MRNRGGLALGGVDVVRYNQNGVTILAVRGTDSALWIGREDFHSKSNKDLQWKRYPGDIASVPTCTSNDCFAILPDGQLGFLDLAGRL